MDYTEHFAREADAFCAAARVAASSPAAPVVPSCPGWVVTDLVLHLGMVHRLIGRIIRERMQQPPDYGDRSLLELEDTWADWLPPGSAPRQAPVPAGVIDWFQDGASGLLACFRTTEPGEQMWTWSPDHSAGFWQRMQAIEAAVHRWDAENALGEASPLDAELAADAVVQTFEVMAPMRRAVAKAPPGEDELFLFRRTDGPDAWTVRFDSDAVRVGEAGGRHDVEISGTASDLALFLWQRHADVKVSGDASLVSRYFMLVPPL